MHLSFVIHLANFVSQIFSHRFPLVRFLSIIPFVIRCSIFSLPNKKVAWRFRILIVSPLNVSSSGHTLSFHFFKVMKFVVLSVGITFLLSLVSFLAVLKLSRPRIHTSRWAQYSTPHGVEFPPNSCDFGISPFGLVFSVTRAL